MRGRSECVCNTESGREVDSVCVCVSVCVWVCVCVCACERVRDRKVIINIGGKLY